MSVRATRGPGIIPEPLLPEAEVAFYRALGDTDRARLLAVACRAGAALLETQDDPERTAQYRDPVPPSTLKALQRLRAEFLAHRMRETTRLRSAPS